jgi:hypothetical protein
MAGKKFKRMVSMERTPAEKADAMMPAILTETCDVPYGLCITLTDAELEKLDLDGECEHGDMIHLFAMARVQSVHQDNNGIRIELAITDLGVEDESTEEEPDDEDGE